MDNDNSIVLARAIVTRLWEEGYIKGSSDKWHLTSLDQYQAELIDLVQETIHGSQGPHEQEVGLEGTVELDGTKVTIRVPTQLGRSGVKLTGLTDSLAGCDQPARDYRPIDGCGEAGCPGASCGSVTETSHHDGGDRVEHDSSPVPCEEADSTAPDETTEGVEEVA